MAPSSVRSYEPFLLQTSSVSADLVWMWAQTGLIFKHCYTIPLIIVPSWSSRRWVALTSAALEGDLPSGQNAPKWKNRGSDGKTCTIHKDQTGEEHESERTRDQSKRSGKLLPEPFKYRNFLQVLACSCPHGSPQMQKPGRSAAADTWSRCQSTRIRRRGRKTPSIKSTGSTSCQAAARGAP